MKEAWRNGGGGSLIERYEQGGKIGKKIRPKERGRERESEGSGSGYY